MLSAQKPNFLRKNIFCQFYHKCFYYVTMYSAIISCYYVQRHHKLQINENIQFVFAYFITHKHAINVTLNKNAY